MDFRLTFDGLLMSTGSTGRPEHIHKVRRRFHPQLRHLWNSDPVVNVSPGVKKIMARRAEAFQKGKYKFLPLVTREDAYSCVIDMLLLRPAPLATSVYRLGDLDGQVATIFDALAMPRHLQQIEGSPDPGEDEDPFYCLLEDDSLITGLSVETGTLLESTQEAGLDRNAMRAVVRVRITWPPKDLGFGKWS